MFKCLQRFILMVLGGVGLSLAAFAADLVVPAESTPSVKKPACDSYQFKLGSGQLVTFKVSDDEKTCIPVYPSPIMVTKCPVAPTTNFDKTGADGTFANTNWNFNQFGKQDCYKCKVGWIRKNGKGPTQVDCYTNKDICEKNFQGKFDPNSPDACLFN